MEGKIMEPVERRAAQGAQLSTTAVAAIVTGIGVVMLCLMIALIFLLVRAIRKHKQLLADLDERGVSIAQAQKDARGELITRPRAVLRRNTILPFNKSGWGSLHSVETFRSTESGTLPAHYAPQKPTEEAKKASRLSWPCSTRRLSGNTLAMKKIKVSRLSTVIEDPKMSPLVPVLGSPHLNESRASLAASSEYGSRTSLNQSLLQYHPAFRSQEPEAESIGADSPTGPNGRLQRAKSVAEVPSLQPSRPQLRARSTSLCSQISGKAPDVILPPLPLDIARTKGEAEKRIQLKHASSKLSVSSCGSVDTGIMSRPSPVVPPQKPRPQKITKPNAKGSKFAGARPFRDTLDLRAKVSGPRNLVQNGSVHDGTFPDNSRGHHASNSGSFPTEFNTNAGGPPRRPQSLTMNRLALPHDGPFPYQTCTPPKRKTKTQVSSSGSPERHGQMPMASSGTYPSSMRSPKRQHSQASSRSSGGNPFQWDPTPLSPSGKPSALKGSPSARQGHRRKNSVRISLVPTIHGPPPSREPSTSFLRDESENSSRGFSQHEVRPGVVGLGLSTNRSLPVLPSATSFAPELKFTATSLRASLTSNSAALPLVGYEQPCLPPSPTRVLPPLPSPERKRSSTGSCYSLSRFPKAPLLAGPEELDALNHSSVSSLRPHDFNGCWMPDTPLLPQYPFPEQEADQPEPASPSSLIQIEEYDPERPNAIYQTPANATSWVFTSAFDAIPEESSIASKKTLDNTDVSTYIDSPPVSPKTLSPPRFTLNDVSLFSLDTHPAALPDPPCDTIDPSLLSKDSFSLLNSSFGLADGAIFHTAHSSTSSVYLPPTPGSVVSLFEEPLLDPSAPSRPVDAGTMDSPTLGGTSPLSSIYSAPSPSHTRTPSPSSRRNSTVPCSPRPRHAELPPHGNGLSINFDELPKLAPDVPRGPRCSPPRPLRTSIAALRRMNSDAAEARNSRAGRGERRYLRLGRGDSVLLSGEESWLDELEDDDAVELDEAEGRRLVGNVLEGWDDEGRTVLDLDESGDMSGTSEATIKPASSSNAVSSAAAAGVDEDTKAGAAQQQQRSSSTNIWEDGERFWASSTPPPTSSPPGDTPRTPRSTPYQPLTSSPVAAAPGTPSQPSTPTFESWSQTRSFHLSQDFPPPSTENTSCASNPGSPGRKMRDAYGLSDTSASAAGGGGGARRGSAAHRNRKRCILGIGTPNVRVQVTTPGGHVVSGMTPDGGMGGVRGGGGNGSPGLMYDSQGFLIF